MATRCNIMYANKSTGKIEAIYCHWDGYPSGTGRILLTDYSDEEKVQALMNLGDISSLSQSIPSQQMIDDYSKNKKDSVNLVRFTEGYTCPYSVRGEDVPKREKDDWESFMGAEYVYVYHKGQWWCSTLYAPEPAFELLKDVVIRHELADSL